MKKISLIATIIFGLNLFLPLLVSAQEVNIGGHIYADATDLAIDSLGPSSLTFPPVKITSPRGNYNSYHFTTYEEDKQIKVHDGRFNGGFVLQVQISDYADTKDPNKKIPISNIAIVTEQDPSQNIYNENLNQKNGFVKTSGELIKNSNGDDIELVQSLPFNFVFYGKAYHQIHICTNGYIGFKPGCVNSGNILNNADGIPKIIPYFKDLTTVSGGIYFENNAASTDSGNRNARIRFDASPVGSTNKKVEFEVVLYKDNRITFEYGEINDDKEGPVIGVTDGKGISSLSSSLNKKDSGLEISNKHISFLTGITINEVIKAGTPPMVAPLNGLAVNPNTYTQFINESTPLNALYGPACSETEGRVGTYILYPSYRLHIPPTTKSGNYKSTITWTVQDETINCESNAAPS